MKNSIELKIVENTPEIETERLILRKFTSEDAEAFFLIMKDKEVNKFLPWLPLATLDEAEKNLQKNYLSSYEQPSGYKYAICLKSDNIPIGYVNLSNDDSHDLGYGLRKEFWRKGIVTEACKVVVERLRKAGFLYITATHDVNNPRSGDVMKKIGMTYQYSYEEQWKPKDILITFRMYQLNFNKQGCEIYRKYWNKYPIHFIEKNV
jgi:[ribosomal protein S5]-alanine N-acetyltransferase